MSDSAVAALLRQTRERPPEPKIEQLHEVFAEEEEEDEGHYRAFGVFRLGPGFGLDFRFAVGRELELSYAHLYANDFDPSGQMCLQFSGGEKVTIRGKNLRPLRDAIRRRKAAWVRELDDPALVRDLPEQATVVTAIEVTSG